MTPPHRIDVHHHIVPGFYVERLAGIGVTEGGGRPLPRWTVEDGLAMMDRHGIQAAVASISAPGVYFGDAAFARGLARDCNDYMARLREDHPGRFAAFAALPMPDAEGAVEEAVYALDTLKLDGVTLLTVAGGRRPAEADYAELFDELNRRGAVVFLHPDRVPAPGDLLPPFLVDFVYETTRTVAELIYTGTMARTPDIRMILSHAGGTVPYLAWRLSQAEKFPEYRDMVPDGVMTYLKRFYYDTALSASRYAFRSLQELVDDSRILFGSDYAYVGEPVVAATIRRVGDYDGFDADAVAAVERGNALRLFPALATALGEAAA